MKILNGAELAGYIKERQAKQVRALRQSWKVFPRMAIVRTGDSQITDTYLRLKVGYGQDILVDVDVYSLLDSELIDKIKQLNDDDSVQGVIVQLPLSDPSMTEMAVSAVAPEKDIDGLGQDSPYTPATVLAINWLLSGYNVNLTNKKIAIVGNGRLVGAPLYSMWQKAGYDSSVFNSQTKNLKDALITADIVVSAAGVPGLIDGSMLKNGAIVVDAGTSYENGKIVGDLSDGVRSRNDLAITPVKGGVGPLTISALFDNLLQSARKIADTKGQQDLF